MEKTRSAFIVAACLVFALCAACGKQEERTQPVQSSSAPLESAGPAPQKTDTRPVLVTFGDSLTAGVAGRSYPDDLQDLLDQHGFRYRVDNQGVSGDTTTDGLARIDNVIEAKPVLVLLEFGGNDGLRGIPVDATKKNLADMIERLESAKVPIVLLGITLPPNYGPDYVGPFTAIFPALAKQYKLKLMPFLLLHVYRKGGLMQPDGIHPNGEGNRVVAQDVFDLIQPLLRH